VPYLGPVPAMALDGKPENNERPELVTLQSPKSTASEAYRGIRTSILFSSAEKQPQVLLVSSAAPQEGKTSTALNLAITMAQTGGKVILLDCDMRKPSLHKVFGLPRDKGMSSILVGNCEVKDALLNTPVPNLDMIPCGPIPPNPSEILGSPRMAKLLELLRKSYSRVIVDTPPITAVTDAVVIGRLVDGAVIVVRAGATPREIVRNGLIQLKAVSSPILGVVLNGVDMDRDGYYYYQYYYYYYGEDGSKKKRVHTKKRSKIGYGQEADR
jgi:succinoglycan biosynthesis transport protein ExoP